MNLTWIFDSIETVIGGPEVPLAGRLLRGALLLCSLFVSVHWFSLWGTRWGDRHRVAKSFVLAILLHLCLCLGWADVVQSNRMGTGGSSEVAAAQIAVEPVPVSVVEERGGAASSVAPTDRGAALWQRPIQGPSSPSTRFHRQQEPASTEVPRMEVSLPGSEMALETPRLAFEADEIPTEPRRSESPQVRPMPSPSFDETLLRSDELSSEVRREAQSALRFQRTSPRKGGAPSGVMGDGVPGSAASPVAVSPAKNGLPAGTGRVVAGGEPGDGPAGATSYDPSIQPRRAKPPMARSAPAPLLKPEANGATIGILRGVVKDAETGRVLAGTTIRFDQARGKPLTAVTDADGHYTLTLPETPDNFAVTASRSDYLPEARNLKSVDVQGTARRLDFALRQPTESVIPLEDEPEVHHLGNDRFEGSVNSQFQRRSEGKEREFRFVVTPAQRRRSFTSAAITVLAKGVQCAPKVWINDRLVDSGGQISPTDGSYGTIELPFDARWLNAGENTFVISAVDCNGDLDDFEFVNVQIRLWKKSATEAKD